MSDIDKDFAEARRIFLSEVDEETQKENEEQLNEWERAIVKHQSLAEWRDHDVTKLIAAETKEQYAEYADILSRNRTLTQAQREALWAKQDAMLWLIEKTDPKAKEELARIHIQIRRALQAAA